MPQLVTEEKEEEKGEGAMRGEGAADEAAPAAAPVCIAGPLICYSFARAGLAGIRCARDRRQVSKNEDCRRDPQEAQPRNELAHSERMERNAGTEPLAKAQGRHLGELRDEVLVGHENHRQEPPRQVLFRGLVLGGRVVPALQKAQEQLTGVQERDECGKAILVHVQQLNLRGRLRTRMRQGMQVEKRLQLSTPLQDKRVASDAKSPTCVTTVLLAASNDDACIREARINLVEQTSRSANRQIEIQDLLVQNQSA
eukprot:scaffold1070_cov245-Pinguiococcus_pyrenoidosus.AAC.49